MNVVFLCGRLARGTEFIHIGKEANNIGGEPLDGGKVLVFGNTEKIRLKIYWNATMRCGKDGNRQKNEMEDETIPIFEKEKKID